MHQRRAGLRATVKITPRSIPGFNDNLQKYPFITNYSASADWTVNNSTVVEATWGFIRNHLGTPIVNPDSNRCNDGLCDLPSLFPRCRHRPIRATTSTKS